MDVKKISCEHCESKEEKPKEVESRFEIEFTIRTSWMRANRIRDKIFKTLEEITEIPEDYKFEIH